MNIPIYEIGTGRARTTPAAEVVGGKAANLMRLDQLGLRVPPALALDTSLAKHYLTHGVLPSALRSQLEKAFRQLEVATGQSMGDERPLLVSIRSSPPVSMPGMLESVLNVGLTESGISGLIRRTGNPWLAWDAYRRLVLSFAGTVRHQPVGPFADLAARQLEGNGATSLQDLDPLSMRDLARQSADLLATMSGFPLPGEPIEQVLEAIEVVLRSWSAPRANEYRRLNHLASESGTGVLIQTMVFGNNGPTSGSGVGFTRNPATGDDELYVDFALNAQGEDIVSGRHRLHDAPPLSVVLPGVWAELVRAKSQLEWHFGDMQDFEFTVDGGRLYFLQTRAGKRTPWAALRIATALVAAGLLEPGQALARLATVDLEHLDRMSLRPAPGDLPVARATTASAGVVAGALVFNSTRAQELSAKHPVILARTELVPDDIAGLAASVGLLTTFGGRTSHAAVVARQLGKVCLVGCADLHVDRFSRSCALGARHLNEGDVVTLDGDTGFVYSGSIPTIKERPEADLAVVAEWRLQDAGPAPI